MGERAVLQIEIDANGVITGSQKSVRSIDEIKRSAGGLDKTVASASASLAKFGAVAALAAVAVGVVALRGLVGVMADVVKEASDDANALAQLQAVVKSTGGAAGLSAQEMSDLGGSLQLVSKFGDDSIASMQAVLATFTNIRGPAFTETTTAILDMATALGLDLQQAAIQVGKSINDPVKGLQLLGRIGVSFTDGQRDMVKQLMATGDTLGAQRVILAELNKEFGGSAAASVGTYTGQVDQLNKRWEIFKEVIGQQLLPILTNLVTQLVTLASDHQDLAKQVADVVIHFTRLTIIGAGFVAMAVEMATAVGVKLNRAYATLADTLAGLTFGETSAMFAQASKNASENADVMEVVSKASGDLAGVLLRVGVGLGEVKATGDAARVTLGAVGDTSGQSAADAKKFADSLQGILDEVDPTAKKVNDLFEKIEILQKAIATGSKDKLPTYIAALRDLQAQLHAIATEADLTAQTLELLPVNRTVKPIKEQLLPQQATMTISQDSVSGFEKEMDAATERLSANLQQGMEGAFAGALAALASGQKVTIEDFGRSLLQVAIQAVTEYLARMLSALATELAQRLSNVAVEAGARQASGAVTGATGGAGQAVSGQMMGQGAAVAGGSSMSGLGTFLAGIAVFAAAVAMFKHQTDRHEAMQFGTTSGVKVTNGTAIDGWTGKLDKSGPMVAQAIGGLLSAFQTATGSFMEGIATAEVEIRNDKQAFRAVVNGIMVGEFETAGEAIIAAAKSAFLGSSLSRELDPLVRKVFEGFSGTDPQKLLEAVQSVQSVVDKLSGITEVEVKLRDLPARTAAFAAELVGLGLAFDDANELAGRWRLGELQSLRDEITGRQKTNAELMAEQQRKAAMYNAEVTLLKAETQMKRDDLAVRIAVLKANGQLFEGQAELDKANLAFARDVLMNKADLYENEAQINQWYLETLGQTANASLLMLEAQLAALDAMLANMPDLISPGEIHLPGRRGGGSVDVDVDTGPTEAEQRAADFDAFIREQMASGLSDLQQRLRALDEAFAAQALAASEVEGGEAALAAARKAAIDALNEDLIDGLGSPTEALRDRFADMREAIDQIRSSAERGSDTLDHLNEVLSELGMQASVEVLSLAADIADAFGMDKQAADFRAKVAELDLRLKIIQLQLLFKEYQALGMIDEALEATFKEFFLFIGDPANWPDFTPPEPPPPPRDTSGADAMEEARKRREQLLTQALDRLRNALDDYRAFQEDLLVGPLSGATLQQQAANAQTEYERLLALAQAGNLDAIEALPAAARQYLELAGEFLDPSSAGYQQILSLVQGQMAGVQQTIEDVLNSVPAQMAGVEDRLDTIAELLAIIAGVGAGTAGTTENHAGMAYYGPIHGWHPLGWAPSGGYGANPFAGEEGGRAASSPMRFGAGGDFSRNVIAAKFSNASVVKVHDAETQRSIARLEAKLERIEAAQVVDTSKAERHRRQQAPRGAKRVGGAYRDEVAG